MNENCKDCPYIQNLKEDIHSLKADIKDLDERVIVVEKFSASGGEQIKMIFKILNEIKDSIKDIGSKLEKIEEKPGEDYSKIKLALITSICTGIVGIILGIIFTKN
ncbi:hypothetical protein OSC52_15190 [Clostridium pasteurianum]|uniref:hypothetical protein n=1 Tax=Clostridium pasteurianum TaxID=1501 RepID=UPI002260C742|nr:hypothetical protein [Clostridium pasteurianum]UZW13181.1 hypothetical protein OSC52_15190 [Clostridium pasteurianum]